MANPQRRKSDQNLIEAVKDFVENAKGAAWVKVAAIIIAVWALFGFDGRISNLETDMTALETRMRSFAEVLDAADDSLTSLERQINNIGPAVRRAVREGIEAAIKESRP